MDKELQQFQHLKIHLEEIKSAINFDDDKNCIGVGGFGRVYKGEMSHAEGRSMAAIKRLDREHGQGNAEFLKEIKTLSRYKHENLISLMGFCYDGDEAILVYELASRGSLEKHLGSGDFTWTLRLKTCLGAAKGLRHLHDPRGTHQRLIHCDVKSGNILLDDHWNAKVADFGFSTMGPANELHSTIITLAVGTLGYCDPQYVMGNTLTKESDVYSFGVVLVEVLCGALCYTYSNGSVQYNLVPTWIKSYEDKKLYDTVFKDPTIEPMHQSVLEAFSDIAYQCLKESREDRPTMAEVVTQLETALEIQELLQNQEFISEWNAQSVYYKAITMNAEPPLNYRSEDELKNLLSKGVLLNGGKTYFSLNKKAEHCEMVSIAECLGSEFKSGYTEYKSRFSAGLYCSWDGIFKTRVKTQFLSPGITYTVNLVFKFRFQEEAKKCEQISLKYKLQGETETSLLHLAYEREDGWWMAELYQFTSDNRVVDLQILFDGFHYSIGMEVEGIEFRPLEKVEHKEDEMHLITDSDVNWEENLPTNYEDIMKRSKNGLQWTTKEDVYLISRKGFLISDDKMKSIWFYLDKNGKKCHILPAAYVCKSYVRCSTPWPLLESRFGEVLPYDYWHFIVKYEVQSQLVSSKTTYAIYLVYKLAKRQSGFDAPMLVKGKRYLGSVVNTCRYIYLVSPQTPVIKPKTDQNSNNPTSKLIKESIPQQRNDGWMEVQLLEFRSDATTMIPTYIELESTGDRKKRFMGLVMVGIEIRPI